MHIEMHMDTVQCPMLICDIIDQNIAVTALLLQMYLSLISESSLNRVSDFNFWKKAVSENVMGVAVLQLYPVQDNRTGPQVVELLTKRIVNQG